MNKLIKISKNFHDLLEKIKPSSNIASIILETTKEGHTLPVNEKGIDYLSISEADSNKISYLNCDRLESISESEYWSSGRRYHILPGKIISKLFDKSIMNIITPKDIEIFSNVYRSNQVENKVKFEIVKGNIIKQYYNQNNYARNNYGELCGSLGASCMRYDKCYDYLSIYSDNKEVSMLCLLDKDSNQLIGRALLWNIEATDINMGTKSFKIMDRIYTLNDDFYTNLFKSWAKNNDYYYKQEQNFNNCIWFEKNGKLVDLYLSFKLNIDNKFFPYLDTFKFLDINTSTLYNYPVSDINNLKIMSSIEGYLNKGTDYCLDELTKIVYHRNDTMQLSYSNNIRVYNGNVFHSYINDCYIHKNHAIYNNEVDDYIFNEEFNHLNNIEKIEKIILDKKTNNDNSFVKLTMDLSSNLLSNIDEDELENNEPTFNFLDEIYNENVEIVENRRFQAEERSSRRNSTIRPYRRTYRLDEVDTMVTNEENTTQSSSNEESSENLANDTISEVENISIFNEIAENYLNNFTNSSINHRSLNEHINNLAQQLFQRNS